MDRTERIPIDQLVLDPVQTRETPWVGDDQDRQLATSVARVGLLQPLLVRPLESVDIGASALDAENASYVIVAGSRRYHAAMDAGYEAVPCTVLEAPDLEAAWTSLLENTDRKALSEQEIAQQLAIIYEQVRPLEEPTVCPACGASVDGERGLHSHYGQTDCTPPPLPGVDGATGAASDGDTADTAPVDPATERFSTDRQARRYLAWRFLGRTDSDATESIAGHLRTAHLPELVQTLFKDPEERTAPERTALENYNIDSEVLLGSGEGRSGTASAVASLHDAVASDLDEVALDPAETVLETVGTLPVDDLSEQQLRRTLRDVRRDLTTKLDPTQSAAEQRQQFTETLQKRAPPQRDASDDLDPDRPFRKVDVMGPESQRHSRWHARAMAQRDVRGHGELVRQLYQERLATLADERGWE